MNPLAIGAVLLAIVGGAGGALGGQLWAGVSALVRRPFRDHAATDSTAQARLPGGATELAALEQAPADRDRAIALAEVLVQRAGADAVFKLELEGWWERSAPIRTGGGNVSNMISGGIQQGPVIQGRDFTGLTFNATLSVPPSPVPSAQDQNM